MNDNTGMERESNAAHVNSLYGTSSTWTEAHSYSQSATAFSETGGYDYMPTGLLPLGRIATSPTLRQQQQSHPRSNSPSSSHEQSHYSQFPMPSLVWPSMLTNPVSYPPAALAASPPAPLPPTMPLRTTSTSPRRTLTDDDRRRICQYHVENPTAKQIDIGRKFGVDRSTVSKVLRHMPKYLGQESRSPSPAKRKKKLLDIERALAAWARKTQQSGIEVTNEDIREKAQHFGHVANDSEHVRGVSDSWLEKFKQKHGIGHAKLSRRASETSIPANGKMSIISVPVAHLQKCISPASPTVQPSPPFRSDADLRESVSGYYSFRTENVNQSLALWSPSTKGFASSLSRSNVSPARPFLFSADYNAGGFLPDQQLPVGRSSVFQRPRSQTFPNIDCSDQRATNPEPITPKYPVSSAALFSALDSPASEIDTQYFTLDFMISSPAQLHRSCSNDNLLAASEASHMPNVVSPISSSVLPTLEDARRGLDLALDYLQKSAFWYDENDLKAIIRFFESVGISQYAEAPESSMHPMSG